ncbi:ABC transporter permease [Actinomadura hibisca]|uniref:ABC transporter permease n=1 Tax=Actinomadura hibisca TaxID=68565 RepID=UPI00082DEC65|nr:FtsX-like permease family protein [Actinomadura hibisca]
MLKTALAGLRAHKLRLLLTGLAITLGVGFIAGTFVLTDTIDKGVDETFARSAGKVDLAVVPKSGPDEKGVPVGVLAKVRGVPGVTEAQGLIDGNAPLLGRNGKALGDMPTAAKTVPSGRLLRYEVDKGRVPSGPNEVVLDSRTAEREKFGVGQAVTVLDHRDRPRRFTVVGLLDFGIDADASTRGAVGFDPATAVRMTGAKTFGEIDVVGGDRAAVARAAGGAQDVLTGEELAAKLARSAGADTKMIRAGLLVFGVVAMLVSALVIYNTFSILIAQRMREMALLRCVGATRRQVFGSVLAESVVVGLVGSLLGLVVGLGLGAGALALFNLLGAHLPETGATLAPRTVAVGLLVGVLVTVVSAVLPARAATRIAPVAALRSDLEPGTGRFRLGWPRTVAAAFFLLLGAAIGGFGTFGMKKGDIAMYVVAAAGTVFFLGVIILMPALVRPLSRLVGALPGKVGGVPARLAVANAQRAPRRTATTTIALTVGVGLMSLFAVVAASGKAMSNAQMDKQFPVDFQVQAQFKADGKEHRVPHALAQALRQRPEFSTVIEARGKETEAGREKVDVTTLSDGALGTVIKPTFKSGSAGAFKPGTALTDAFTAEALHVKTGDTVRISTRQGAVPVRIAGVYGADVPLSGLLVPDADFDRYFDVRDPTSIYAKTRDGVDAAAARQAIEDAARPYPTAQIGSQAEMREQISEAVDMILMIFGGLLGLAVIIALFGIANTLTLSVVERTRESALLRALGLTRRQLRRMLSVEALVMAVIGAFTGVVLGIGFGWAATTAMSENSVFTVPFGQIAGFIVLAGLAGMLAAVLPARRAAKASIVESLAHD